MTKRSKLITLTRRYGCLKGFHPCAQIEYVAQTKGLKFNQTN